MRKNLAVLGFWLAPLLREKALVEEALAFLLPRLGRGLKPVVGKVFPFLEAEAAFRTSWTGGTRARWWCAYSPR